MKATHTAAWVGITAAALLTTTACGAASVGEAAKAVDRTDVIMAALARATDRTEDVGSAQVRMSTDLGTGAPVTMEGLYSWGDGFAYDVEMDTAAAQMQTLTDDPSIRVLFVDGAYYYDVDPQPSGPLAGKEWMKIDGSAVFGESGAQALSGSNGSPSASMKGLKYADDVTDLGEETVDGRSTTHYRAVLGEQQMGRFADALGDEDTLAGSMTGGASSISMDVWVGADDLPVRLKEGMGAMTVTMDFEKFGETAEVEAPPAAETADMSQALKDMQEQ
ncbi:hypothetical protein ACIPSE_02370 [Streptomyces sp. NPDC090106]|uniref:hypothetical protein n=1 Tax=Streptomyces sp. NPDC090106 TaxID=3365946 RepID=UPI00382BDF47